MTEDLTSPYGVEMIVFCLQCFSLLTNVAVCRSWRENRRKKKIMEAYSQWLGCILTENTRIRSCWSIGLYQAIIMLMFARQVSKAKNSAPSLMVITLMPSSIVFNWGNLEWSVLCYGPFFFLCEKERCGKTFICFLLFSLSSFSKTIMERTTQILV